MDEQKRQLVQRVTEEVIAAIQAKQGHGTAPAAIRPPIGTCTGDYSKFEELRGGLGGTQSAKPQAAAESAVVALSGIVTARQLQDAIATAVDGVVWLGPDARPTPLANDLVRQMPDKIRRANGPAPGARHSAADTPWLWWIDGHCPVAFKLMQERSGHVRPSSVARQTSSLGQVVRDIAQGLRIGQISGAIVFVPNGAKAMCFANRCASIRAVMGTCAEAVEQGINELGMNVLVIEYPHVAPAKMETMVNRMLGHAPKAPAQVQRELADLHRCN